MSMRLTRSHVVQGGVSLVCAVGLAFVGVVPVAAAEPDAVDVASQVVPSEVADATVDEHALDVAVRTGDIAVTVPSDAEDGIGLFLPGPDDFTIGLPFAGEAALASTDAGISFDNGNGSSTVPLVKDDGVVQLLTTIADADAPTSYSYPLDLPDGAVLTLTSDGGAEVINGNGVVIATVDAPWAVDANGNAVATHYEVSGDTLTQVVAFTTTTAFPVVADPTLSLGWWYYLHFNRVETKSVANMSTAAGTISAMCAIAGGGLGPIGAAALGAACAAQAFSIVYTANLAQNATPKRCLFLKWRPVSGGNVYPGTYVDGRCK